MNYLMAQKIFTDERSTKILLAALYAPRTALDIRKATGIPVAKLFARIKVLEKKGLIKKVSATYALDGREMPLYQSMLFDALVFMDQERLKVKFQLESCEQKEYTVDSEALL